MQAGFGRTGLNFGFEHYKVDPDMICCGKGMEVDTFVGSFRKKENYGSTKYWRYE